MRDVFVCSHDSMWQSFLFFRCVDDTGYETRALIINLQLVRWAKKNIQLTVQRTTNFYYEPYCNALSIRLSVNNFDIFSNIMCVRKTLEKSLVENQNNIKYATFEWCICQPNVQQYQNASHDNVCDAHRLLNFLTCQQFFVCMCY